MLFSTNKTLRMAQLAVSLSAVFWMAGTSANTVISEVLYDATTTDNGNTFVELFGMPGALLDDLFLDGVNGLDGSVYRSVALSGAIPADGVFLIGDDNGDGTTNISNADLVLDVDFQNGPDSIVLRMGDAVLDALGYGDFSMAIFAGEGDAAVDAPAGSSLARSNPMLDSNNNRGDFFLLDMPTPGSVPGGMAGGGPVNPVPLPPAVLMMLSGLIGLVGVARRQ